MNHHLNTIGRYSLFLFRQIFYVLTLLFAVTVISFALVSFSPVDPVKQFILGSGTVSPDQRADLEEYWGLNEPPVGRYFKWLGALLHGDMGSSLLYRKPVIDVIGERFGNSLALMGLAWVLSGVIGFTLGCVMGSNRGRAADRIIKRICLVLCSVPTFWLGLILLLIFSVSLGWFPIGMSRPIGILNEEVTILQRLHHLVLPALTLSLLSFANIALHTRQKLIDVMESDYVLFARARGESSWSILKRHGLRNIALPAVTLQFASFAELFGGSILAENVFSCSGLGTAISAAGLNSDVPLLLGLTLFSVLFVYTGNMIANILYGLLDPQVREGYHRG